MAAQTPLTRRRWQRAEYERLVALGVLEGEPVELIGGELIVAEPQGPYHAGALTKVDYALRRALPAGWIVRLQAPVSLDDESQPEPDVVVVAGQPGDYLDAHPTRPILVVEVAESSLSFDRERKGSLYARASIPEYWILNLADRVLEVYRDPEPDASAVFGWRYRSVATMARSTDIAPLAFPAVRVPIAELLP